MRARHPASTAARLVGYDLLSQLRGPRWLILPLPAAVAGWLAADDLDVVGVAWGPGDLIGALVTVPMLVALLLGLPVAAVTTDLALRQLHDGTAALTATRVGPRRVWWNAKLMAIGTATLLCASGMLLVVAVVGVARSGNLTVFPGPALDRLLGLADATASSTMQVLLVVSAPLSVTLAIWPTVAVAATIGMRLRSNVAAGAAVAILTFGITLMPIAVDAGVPETLLAIVPSSIYGLPLTVVWTGGTSPWLLSLVAVGWLVFCSWAGARGVRDLR